MDLLNGGLESAVASLEAHLHSPVEALGFVLAATSVAAGLVLRWVRRAVRG